MNDQRMCLVTIPHISFGLWIEIVKHAARAKGYEPDVDIPYFWWDCYYRSLDPIDAVANYERYVLRKRNKRVPLISPDESSSDSE